MHDVEVHEYDPQDPDPEELTGYLDFSGEFLDEDRWQEGYDY